MRILILEDETIIAGRVERICREYFGTRIYALHKCDELASARELLAEQTVDLLLLDLNLNGRNGLSLLETSCVRIPRKVATRSTAKWPPSPRQTRPLIPCHGGQSERSDAGV